MKLDKTLLSDALLLVVTVLAALGWIFSKEALQIGRASCRERV